MHFVFEKKSSIHDFNSLMRDIHLRPIERKVLPRRHINLLFLIAAIIILAILFWPSAAKPEVKGEVAERINLENIITLANEQRVNNGLVPLQANEELIKLAQIRADDMRLQNYFDHVDPNGHGLGYFLKQIDYDYLIAGENLAINFYNNERLIDAWMNSETHRRNIMNPIFQDIGLYQENMDTKNHEKPVIVMILGRKIE